MRKLIPSLVLAAGLLVPAQASAAIPEVFTGAESPPIACEVQGAGANEGERFCTTPAGEDSSRVASFDDTPVDVAVALPPEPETGADGDFPLIGIFHGYGGNKNDFELDGAEVQHWVDKGYAVFTMTDRGFDQSCGRPESRENLPSYFDCDAGYIRLMDQRYEVRDAQTMMGLLADDGAIDPTAIGVGGGSYGGGMAVQLGALKNRIRNEDGSYSAWTSPDGLAMEISASAPQITWSNLSQALLPNGSRLDYVTEDPYYSLTPGADRTGVEKQLLLTGLYANGQAPNGYYQPTPGGPADVTTWKALFDTGGPYDTGPNADAIRAINSEIENFHSVAGISITDGGAVEPAPALLSNGWVDDLFPVEESVGYYNRVRAAFPDNPISMFHYNQPGHPRGTGRAGDAEELLALQDEWMDFYVKGEGTQPDPYVKAKVMTCQSSQPSGPTLTADTWAGLAPGEVTFDGDGGTIQPGGGLTPQPGGGAPTSPGTDCGSVPANPDSQRAVITRSDPAPAGGYTIAGSPTVLADWSLLGSNDQVAVRLVDLASENATSGTLVARGTWRPIVGDGAPIQAFQLHPNAWKVEEGHVLALQMLPSDAIYTRQNPNAGGTDTQQNPVGVSNIEVRLPVNDEPGSSPAVGQPADKLVPEGYELSDDYAPAETRINASVKPKRKAVKRGKSAVFTLSIRNPGPADTVNLRACPRVPKPLTTRGCVNFADLSGGGGATAQQRFRVTAKRKAKPKLYPISFRVSADNAPAKIVKAKLKVRR